MAKFSDFFKEAELIHIFDEIKTFEEDEMSSKQWNFAISLEDNFDLDGMDGYCSENAADFLKNIVK